MLSYDFVKSDALDSTFQLAISKFEDGVPANRHFSHRFMQLFDQIDKVQTCLLDGLIGETQVLQPPDELIVLGRAATRRLPLF